MISVTRYLHSLIILGLFILPNPIYSQAQVDSEQQDSLLVETPMVQDSTIEDSLAKQPTIRLTKISRGDSQQTDGYVRIIEEERIHTLDKIIKNQPYEHNGFRIQIVFGTKEMVNSKRSAFNSKFSYKTYVDWLPPNFRLRVGDFPTKQLADKHLNKIRRSYPDAYIVKDKINTPSKYR